MSERDRTRGLESLDESVLLHIIFIFVPQLAHPLFLLRSSIPSRSSAAPPTPHPHPEAKVEGAKEASPGWPGYSLLLRILGHTCK